MSGTDKAVRDGIEKAMRAAGKSASDIARDLEVSRSHVSQVLVGKRSTIPQSLIDILENLDLELVALPKGTDLSGCL